MDFTFTLSDRNKDRLEHDKALANKDKAAVVNQKTVVSAYKFIHKKIVKLIDLPVAAYALNFHKVHFEYLAIVLVAVKNTSQATEAIAGMKMNLDSYVSMTEQVLRKIEELPEDPLPGLNPLDHLYLSRDPEFVEAHDRIIEDYRTVARENLTNITHCAKQGRDIYASTNTEAKKLLDDLMKVQPQSDMEKLIIEANKRDLKWLILSLDKIRTVYQKADAAVPKAQRMAEFADQFVKIAG